MSDDVITTEEIADTLGVSLVRSTPTVAERLALIEDLTIGDCLNFFYERATPRDNEIAHLAPADDELEVDGAIISESDANGAWVLAWCWVSFEGTPLDKEIKKDEDDE